MNSLSPSYFCVSSSKSSQRGMVIQHSTICRNAERSPPQLTSDEIHVAQVLLDITTMIRALESGSSDLKWGSKKRRSTLMSDHQRHQAAVSSPVTPLSFCPTESDHHSSNHLFNIKSKKMWKRGYMEVMIGELSQRRDLLRGEIKEVTIYYNKLIAQNSQLKAMKKEMLNCCPRKEELNLETSTVGTKLIPKSNQIRAIPDLNVCAQEMDPNQAWDRRTGFAEARRRRKDILTVKSFKFPRTK